MSKQDTPVTFNEELVKQVRLRNMAIKNSHPAMLKILLKHIYPNDIKPSGNAQYYFTSISDSCSWDSGGIAFLPARPVSEFFIDTPVSNTDIDGLPSIVDNNRFVLREKYKTETGKNIIDNIPAYADWLENLFTPTDNTGKEVNMDVDIQNKFEEFDDVEKRQGGNPSTHKKYFEAGYLAHKQFTIPDNKLRAAVSAGLQVGSSPNYRIDNREQEIENILNSKWFNKSLPAVQEGNKELIDEINRLQEKYDENGYDFPSAIKLQRIEQHILLSALPHPIKEEQIAYTEIKCNGCGCNKYRAEFDYNECINCSQRFVIEDGEVHDIETPIK